MPSISENRSHTRLANLLIAGCGLLIVFFWGAELRWALDSHEQQGQDLIERYQRESLNAKADAMRDLFEGLYSTSRTVSLLPMVRSVRGPNRHNVRENVVADGRFSLDAHRSMQQIYTNLHQYLQVSEIYLVLDGFDPARGDVPFFMYDDAIAGVRRSPDAGSDAPVPAEVEDFEYAHFPKQLEWFRTHAPTFVYADRLDEIPVLLSPLMRTCDNAQFPSELTGNLRDVEGLIYAMPVYGLDSQALRGMVTTIIRANAIEARLIGVPRLPVTPADRKFLQDAGVVFPERASPFYLRNAQYGFDIFDRRNTAIAEHLSGKPAGAGRWMSIRLDLKTGSPWELGHHLGEAEIASLLQPVAAARQRTIAGRVALLAVVVVLFVWAVWLVRRSRRELLRMAQFDFLTELPNRRAFFERLDAAISRGRRNNRRVGLFFLDIAGFSAINDTLGQQAGDRLLAAVAERLRICIRNYDMVTRGAIEKRLPDSVSRLGGDEFTVLCEDLKEPDDLAIVAERILESMKPPFQLGHDEVEASMYIGIASFPEDAGDGEKLLMSAESAMQACRRMGPGFRLFNEEMRLRAARQHQLMVELQFALERRQFVLHYQPTQVLANGRIASLEALIRWQHPDFGTVSPVEFIPLLERSGRIIPVGEWVLEQSCADLKSLMTHGDADLRVSVNVSVRQLRRGNFKQAVQRVLAESGLDADRLVLELTESMVMENIEEGRATLEQLGALGVRLAVDDFGTGYSSLTYLQHLPIDYLKLDKSFIDGMVNDRARHIVRSVISLAQGLKLETIAEGIEQVEQAEQLAAMGCDMIQGYLLSRPQPIDDIAAWLDRRRGVGVS